MRRSGLQRKADRPVLIDVTKDVTAAECDYIKETPKAIERQTDTIKEEDVERAVEMIKASKRPYVFVGGGVIASDALMLQICKEDCAPVADSLMGKGAFDGTDPQLYRDAWYAWYKDV